MLSIGKLAALAEVNIETVRYYERRGLIVQPNKPTKGYRCYPETTLKRIQFIRRAQDLGFTLEEISNLLALDDSPCQAVQGIATQKLASVRAKMADLHRLEVVLNSLLHQCVANSDLTHCPIIESLLPEDKNKF